MKKNLLMEIFVCVSILLIVACVIGSGFMLRKELRHKRDFPSIATKATYQVTVMAGGHVWLYDAGVYDIKAMPGAIIHKNGKAVK